jgi:hypothetical protein
MTKCTFIWLKNNLFAFRLQIPACAGMTISVGQYKSGAALHEDFQRRAAPLFHYTFNCRHPERSEVSDRDVQRSYQTFEVAISRYDDITK